MATRGAIGIYNSNGSKVRAIYCHYDMYPDHAGAVLVNHYNSQERAEALIALGHLEGVDPVLEHCDRLEVVDMESPWAHAPWDMTWGDFIAKTRAMCCEFVYLYDVADKEWVCWGLNPVPIDLTMYEKVAA